jgi:hypothetical protein
MPAFGQVGNPGLEFPPQIVPRMDPPVKPEDDRIAVQILPDLPGLVFILDIRLEKTAVGRSRQEFLIDRFGDILILVDGTDDEFNLKHIALMFVPDPFDLTR